MTVKSTEDLIEAIEIVRGERHNRQIDKEVRYLLV